jgi:L,D-transpeptidase catalytic domain
MRLDGLSPDGSPNEMANSNIRERLIVVHEADYVSDDNADQQGRSNGCLALDPSIEVSVVDRIHDGALVYSAISALAPPVGRTTNAPKR